MFKTVLIAGRGEIACRIISTLKRLGIRSVAVYSDADAHARHVTLADVAVRIGPAPAAQSYLSIPAVLEAARETGAEAIHPGYGFLSENAEFARACEQAGIVFIGPSAAAIETMGDKISAKAAVEQRAVPTVPGIARPGLSDDELLAEASTIGFPLIIKPSAGGGGKGMHIVKSEDQLAAALATARREAKASFGDDSLFIERYLATSRHIEVQVLADAHGNVIHLGERECSLQRRHQKVIEEAPSALLNDEARAAIGQAACETARSVSYVGAGTVEFIVEASRPDDFYFMEMNTRLQVEHPVTEEITGLDLVEQQLRIAAGECLGLSQEEVRLHGHSFEARIYAEDPAAHFLPTGGRVLHVSHPRGTGVRVDTAIATGLNVSTDYDPMLAKIITWGEDRETARRRLVQALHETTIIGFPTNTEFMRLLMELPEVAAGDLDTGLIARVQDSLTYAEPGDREFSEAAHLLDLSSAAAPAGGPDGPSAPWRGRGGWRLGDPAPRTHQITADTNPPDTRSVSIANTLGEAVRPLGDHRYSSQIGGITRSITATVTGVGDHRAVTIAHGGSTFEFTVARASRAADDDAHADPSLDSPMPGTVTLLHAQDGNEVAAGDPVVSVEAMKMEHVLRASVSGRVSLAVSTGEQVARGQTLAVIHADNSDEGEEART